MDSKTRTSIIIGLIVGAICVAGYVFAQKQEGIPLPSTEITNKLDGTGSDGTTSDTLSPTPFPFQEMTVPYLRSRSYTSSFGERELVSSDASYDSYLTSYTSDNLTIYGLLTVPNGEQPAEGWPAIVFIHGYIPPFQYKTLERYGDYVDFLARNGFVVFKIDLRGHGNSEGEANGAYYSSDYVIDALNARAALQSTDFVKPDAVGLWGHSMAGNIVLRSMAVQPDLPAGVIWAGAVYSYADFIKYRITDGSYIRPPEDQAQQRQSSRQKLFAAHGEFTPESPFWKQVAATNYLQDFKGAVQIHHAIDDDVVSVGYTRDLKVLLDSNSVSNEVIEYPTGGHDIEGISFVKAMESTVSFYRLHLK